MAKEKQVQTSQRVKMKDSLTLASRSIGHSDGEYSASLYLADDLQVANWIDSVTLEDALESLRDRMLGISMALQTAVDPN
jgi:hypothetical protein